MVVPREAGLDAVAARELRTALATDLFRLLGDPTPQDAGLETVAARALRTHLAHVSAGELGSAEGSTTQVLRSATCTHVTVLGETPEVLRKLACGELHAWGHFIDWPAAHAEYVAVASDPSGVRRVYVATVWRA